MNLNSLPTYVENQMVAIFKQSYIGKDANECSKFNLSVRGISENNQGVYRIRVTYQGKEWTKTVKSVAYFIGHRGWLPSTIVIHSLCDNDNCCNSSHWDICHQGGEYTESAKLKKTVKAKKKKTKKLGNKYFRL